MGCRHVEIIILRIFAVFFLTNIAEDVFGDTCAHSLIRFVVINMPHRGQRLKSLKKRIGNLNLNSVVEVITPLSRDDMNNIDDIRIYPNWKMSHSSVRDILKEDEKAFQQTASFWTKDITWGEVSLTLAHLEAAGHSDSDALTIVLEDDVVFIEDFVRVLEAIVSELPMDFDMIFLGDEAIGWNKREKVTRFLTYREYAYQVRQLLKITFLTITFSKSSCLRMQILNAEDARIYHQSARSPEATPIDRENPEKRNGI